MNGFSLHAAVRRGAEERQALEQLCRSIARPALIAHDDEREFADQAAGGTSIGLIRGSNPSGGTEVQLTSLLHHFPGHDPQWRNRRSRPAPVSSRDACPPIDGEAAAVFRLPHRPGLLGT